MDHKMSNDKRSAITASNQSPQTSTGGGTQNVPSGAHTSGGRAVIAGAASSAKPRMNGKMGR